MLADANEPVSRSQRLFDARQASPPRALLRDNPWTNSKFPAACRKRAFIAFHGSWNRAPGPQGGYNGVFRPMAADGKASGDFVVVTAFGCPPTVFATEPTLANANLVTDSTVSYRRVAIR